MDSRNRSKTSKTAWWYILLLASMLLTQGRAQAETHTVTYYIPDAQGSPIVAIDRDSGTVKWRKHYRPFGAEIEQGAASQDNRIGYTGHVHDRSSGLTYMGHRYYDPYRGQFNSMDPAAVDPNDPRTFNRYAYGYNSPYGFTDPDGQNAVTAFGGLLYESGQFLTGNGFDGGMVWGALKDGYNGEGDGLVSAAAEDALTFGAGLLGAGVKVYKLVKIAKFAREETTVIGRVNDLQNLKRSEKSLLDRLPDQGSPKTNWKQNSGVLRQEMAKGQPIRDASPGDAAGQFLNAERNLLKDRGWTFDPKANYWNPPAQ